MDKGYTWKDKAKTKSFSRKIFPDAEARWVAICSQIMKMSHVWVDTRRLLSSLLSSSVWSANVEPYYTENEWRGPRESFTSTISPNSIHEGTTIWIVLCTTGSEWLGGGTGEGWGVGHSLNPILRNIMGAVSELRHTLGWWLQPRVIVAVRLCRTVLLLPARSPHPTPPTWRRGGRVERISGLPLVVLVDVISCDKPRTFDDGLPG